LIRLGGKLRVVNANVAHNFQNSGSHDWFFFTGAASGAFTGGDSCTGDGAGFSDVLTGAGFGAFGASFTGATPSLFSAHLMCSSKNSWFSTRPWTGQTQ
jgi:hypothetical protein